MGLMKKLAQEANQMKRRKPKKYKRTPGSVAKANEAEYFSVAQNFAVIPDITEDEDFPVEFTAELRRKVVLPAVRKAGQYMAKDVRGRLKPFSSKKTKTRDKWSKKTRAYHEEQLGRRHLHANIRVNAFNKKKEEQTVATVGPGEKTAWIGWFIEFGRKAVYWGRKETLGASSHPERPFLRPSAAATGAMQQTIIRNYIKQNWRKI